MIVPKYPTPPLLRWFAALSALALSLAEKINTPL